MAVSKAKENILKKIRQALSHPVPLPFPSSEGPQTIFTPSMEEKTVVFAEEFTKLQGKFAYCVDESDLKDQLFGLFMNRPWTKYYFNDNFIKDLFGEKLPNHPELSTCDVAITGCEYLAARTGSIVLSSAQPMGRTSSVYAPVHLCIAYTSQLKDDIRDTLVAFRESYGNDLPSLVTFATGPSRTADIEKTLVTGVHGPKEVYCFLVENQNLTKTTL